MFPATENSTAKERAPGYNWTSYAKNTSSAYPTGKTTATKSVSGAQNTNYIIDPAKYKNWVQKKNYSIYSDTYRDYYVELTPEKIKTIKNMSTNGTKYSSFNSKMLEPNVHVSNYRSDLLAMLGAEVPNSTELRCNNMKERESSQCETFD